MADEDEPGTSGVDASALKEEVFTLRARQAEREHPIDLPRHPFYPDVGALFRELEEELFRVSRSDGFGWSAQAAAKRQAQARRDVAELARRRLNAFAHHATASAVRPAAGPGEGAGPGLPPLEWASHDPAERRFYEGLRGLIGRFLEEVDWNAMQHGTLDPRPPAGPDAGTRVLDAYVEDAGGLTGTGAPAPAAAPSRPETFADPDDEDEERLARLEPFPEWGEHAHPPDVVDPSEDLGDFEDLLGDGPGRRAPGASAAVADEPPPPSWMTPARASPTSRGGEAAGAAESDAAAVSAEAPAAEMDREAADVAGPSDVVEAGGPGGESADGQARIRIIQALPEPMLDEHGAEVDLEVGDVHVCGQDMATALIAAGIAEAAPL